MIKEEIKNLLSVDEHALEENQISSRMMTNLDEFILLVKSVYVKENKFFDDTFGWDYKIDNIYNINGYDILYKNTTAGIKTSQCKFNRF